MGPSLVNLPHEILYGANLFIHHVFYFVRVFDGLDLGRNTPEAQNTRKLEYHQKDAFRLRVPIDLTIADRCRIGGHEVERREVYIKVFVLSVLTE